MSLWETITFIKIEKLRVALSLSLSLCLRASLFRSFALANLTLIGQIDSKLTNKLEAEEYTQSKHTRIYNCERKYGDTLAQVSNKCYAQWWQRIANLWCFLANEQIET